MSSGSQNNNQDAEYSDDSFDEQRESVLSTKNRNSLPQQKQSLPEPDTPNQADNQQKPEESTQYDETPQNALVKNTSDTQQIQVKKQSETQKRQSSSAQVQKQSQILSQPIDLEAESSQSLNQQQQKIIEPQTQEVSQPISEMQSLTVELQAEKDENAEGQENPVSVNDAHQKQEREHQGEVIVQGREKRSSQHSRSRSSDSGKKSQADKDSPKNSDYQKKGSQSDFEERSLSQTSQEKRNREIGTESDAINEQGDHGNSLGDELAGVEASHFQALEQSVGEPQESTQVQQFKHDSEGRRSDSESEAVEHPQNRDSKGMSDGEGKQADKEAKSEGEQSSEQRKSVHSGNEQVRESLKGQKWPEQKGESSLTSAQANEIPMNVETDINSEHIQVDQSRTSTENKEAAQKQKREQIEVSNSEAPRKIDESQNDSKPQRNSEAEAIQQQHRSSEAVKKFEADADEQPSESPVQQFESHPQRQSDEAVEAPQNPQEVSPPDQEAPSGATGQLQQDNNSETENEGGRVNFANEPAVEEVQKFEGKGPRMSDQDYNRPPSNFYNEAPQHEVRQESGILESLKEQDSHSKGEDPAKPQEAKPDSQEELPRLTVEDNVWTKVESEQEIPSRGEAHHGHPTGPKQYQQSSEQRRHAQNQESEVVIQKGLSELDIEKPKHAVQQSESRQEQKLGAIEEEGPSETKTVPLSEQQQPLEVSQQELRGEEQRAGGAVRQSQVLQESNLESKRSVTNVDIISSTQQRPRKKGEQKPTQNDSESCKCEIM